MSNRLSTLWQRIFRGGVSEKSSETWISSTVMTGEAAAGRHSQAPGKTYISRASGYVMICALLVASVCASQRIRMYAPANARGKNWKGKRLGTKTAAERRRIAYLKSRAKGPGIKAAEYAEYADDIQEITEHPALTLLRRPNPWQSGSEFDELAYVFKALAGNAYINTYFDEPLPEMYLLPPQNVTIIPSETEFISGYYYDRNAANPHKFEPDEILHMKHKASPLNPYYGIGPLQSVLLEADLAAAATQSEVARWLNGGRPDFAVKVDQATANNQVARDQIRAEIQRQTKGVKKSGNFLIMGNSEIVPLGFKPKDMEYIAGLTRSDELIWNAFGVPQSELKMNDANYASASTGNVQFLARTIAPLCCRHAQDLTEGLLYKRFGIIPGMAWLAPDPIVPEDEESEKESDRKDVAAGLITWNEGRANRGRDPYDDEYEGDIPRVNGVPVTVLSMPATPLVPDAPQQDAAALPDAPNTGGQVVQDTALNGAQVTALADLVAQVAAGAIPLESARAVAVAAFPAVAPETINAVFSPLVNFEPKPDPVAVAAAESEANPTPDPKYEKRFDYDEHNQRAVVTALRSIKFYGSHLHTKDDRVTGAPRGTIAAIDQFANRLELWHRRVLADALAAGHAGTIITIPGDELQKIIDEELRMILNAAARAGAREVGGSLEVAPTSAFEYLDAYKIRLSHAITDDLATSLNDAIRGGLAAGETYDQVTSRVQLAMPEAARWRSERIARTETATATNEGRVFAWDDLGVKEKRWLLSGNACALCQAVALTYAGPIPMNQPFYRVGDTITGTDGTTMTVTWRDVNAAPLHPQCACGCLPVV